MATNRDNKRSRRTETDYEISVPDGMPSDISEIISKAHAKVESMNRVRQNLATSDIQIRDEEPESAE